MTVIDLKPKRKCASRGLPLEQATDTARFFGRMVRAIETDLGGRRQLSRIETELVHAFAGAATAVNYLNRQVILGEVSEIDLSSFAVLASTMLRIGSKLGLARRSKDITPTLTEYIASLKQVDATVTAPEAPGEEEVK